MSLTIEQKNMAFRLKEQGAGNSEIARKLHCHRNTIAKLFKAKADPLTGASKTAFEIPERCSWETLCSNYPDVPQVDVRAQFEDELRSLPENGKNLLSLTTGKPGVGKSLYSLHLCRLVDPKFDIESIAFTFEQLSELIPAASNGAAMLDDCQNTLGAKKWFEVARRAIHESMSISRHRGLSIIINSHNLTNIDKQTRLLLHYEIHIPCQCGDHIDAILFRLSNSGDDVQRTPVGMMRYNFDEYDQDLVTRYANEKNKYLALIPVHNDVPEQPVAGGAGREVVFKVRQSELIGRLQNTLDEVEYAFQTTVGGRRQLGGLRILIRHLLKVVQEVETPAGFETFYIHDLPVIGNEVCRLIGEYWEIKKENDNRKVVKTQLEDERNIQVAKLEWLRFRLHYLGTVKPITYLKHQRIIAKEIALDTQPANTIKWALAGLVIPDVARAVRKAFGTDNQQEEDTKLQEIDHFYNTALGAACGMALSYGFLLIDNTVIDWQWAVSRGSYLIAVEKSQVSQQLAEASEMVSNINWRINSINIVEVAELNLNTLVLPFTKD